MQTQPEITFRGVDMSPALEANIRERIDHLEKFHPRITSCKVVIHAPHRHQQKGTIYQINVELIVPGKDIAVSRETGNNHAHEDIQVAVRDAFDEARRLLEDHLRTHSYHRTRQPDIPMQGEVARFSHDGGFGFITAADGRDVYFNLDNMPESLTRQIEVGLKVRFNLGEGDAGPYAHAISPVNGDNT